MVLTAGTASNQTENDSAPLKVINKKKRKSPDEDHSSSTVKQKSESKEESKKVKFNEKVEYSEPEKKKRRQSSDENDKSAAGDSSADDGEESGKKKLNNKQLKKLKQKRKEAKKRKGEAKRQKKLEEGVVTPQKHRDFATDLTEYLQQWEDDMRKLNSHSSEKKWKFNKVLQEWALQHCLQKQLVSSELFKKLTPYIATVQGKAKERLVTVLQEVMNREDEAVPETTEGDEGETLAILRSIEKKRAKRLLPLLTSE